MKILTLNTWQERGPWKERWEVIFQGISEMQPDIIGFQEVFNQEWAEEVQKRTGYEGLVFCLEHPGQMILARHKITDWAGLTIPSKSPSEDYLRHALYAEIQIGESSLPFFNTHLSWMLEDSGVREKQVGDLIEFVDDKAGTRESAVVGDFNAPPGTPEIQKMLVVGKFNDSYKAVHPKREGLTWDNRNPFASDGKVKMPDRRLDYIFTRNQSKLLARLKSVELVFTEPDENGVYASDHFGVLAEFE